MHGYDVAGELVFEGQQSDITIGNNDTTLVEFQLVLLVPLPDIDTGSGGQTDGDATGQSDTDGATEPDTYAEPDAGIGEDAEADAGAETNTEEENAGYAG